MKLEHFFLVIAKVHLACCIAVAWLAMVLMALMYTLGVKVPEIPSSLSPCTAFFLGVFVMWIVVATLSSLGILGYFWSRPRRRRAGCGDSYFKASYASHSRPSNLTRCCSDIERLVNLDTILPILYQKGVLSGEEISSLVNIRTVSGGTRSYQVLHFVTILDKKGKHGFDRLVEALKEEKEHMGHEELAEILSQRQRECGFIVDDRPQKSCKYDSLKPYLSRV